jgi:hypothetical protein
MQPSTSCFLLLVFFLFMASCSFVPVTNHYEKAATLKKGGLEFSGNFTGNGITGGGEAENINNNYGFRAGVGVSDRMDLKVRYEKLSPSKSMKEDFKGASYISVIPKFALVPNKLSLLVPVSHYSYKELWDGEETKNTLNSIAPQVIYTLTNQKNKIDFTMGLKGDFLFGGDGGGVIFGATAGAGFSSDLDKWAIRPEVGASFLGGGAFLSYGVGLQLLIPRKKN